jgi:hypothetical protein
MGEPAVPEVRDDLVERVDEEGKRGRVRVLADFKDKIIDIAAEVEWLRHVGVVHFLEHRVQNDTSQVAAGSAPSDDARGRGDGLTDPVINS